MPLKRSTFCMTHRFADFYGAPCPKCAALKEGKPTSRLGKRHLERLRGIGTTAALVVPDAMSRRLCDLGLMKAHGDDGSFAAITPAGLRALADAAEAGRIELFKMPDRQTK